MVSHRDGDFNISGVTIFLPENHASEYTFSGKIKLNQPLTSPQKAGLYFRVFFKDQTRTSFEVTLPPQYRVNEWIDISKTMKFDRQPSRIQPNLFIQEHDCVVYFDDICVSKAGGNVNLVSNPGMETVVSGMFNDWPTSNPVLYHYILSFAFISGINIFLYNAVLGILLSIGTIIAVYMVGKELFTTPKYALCAALFIAVHPYLVRISVDVMREVIYIPLLAGTVTAAAFAVTRGKNFCWYLFGVGSGLMILTRSEGWEAIFALLVWGVFEAVGKKYRHEKISWGGAAVVGLWVIGGLLTVAPLFLYFIHLGLTEDSICNMERIDFLIRNIQNLTLSNFDYL